ncbi:MAG: CDP-glycerol glycerophosphotransferase family protein [candidate division KSB1 bacterium]|nr:CDP-glycerol glycerophosphotransferase family protein [candidate division KSB1 bacterium]
MDYIVMKSVLRHLSGVQYIAKNSRTKKYLKSLGIEAKRPPAFPKAVLMCRHAAHKFPAKSIIKIGFRHGAYHFKTFAGAKYYNLFDIYFFTSEREVELAKQLGVTCGSAVGFPKLDPAFDGSIDDIKLKRIREQAKIDTEKQTLLFTSTWDKSGMSAIERWVGRVSELSESYNVLVTVHPWMSKKYIQLLQESEKIYYIDDPDILPYLMVSDVCIGDYSSILAESCALDKPLITFRTKKTDRTPDEITDMLEKISIRIDEFSQLPNAIQESLKEDSLRRNARKEAVVSMFSGLDGHAGERAAAIIRARLDNVFQSQG